MMSNNNKKNFAIFFVVTFLLSMLLMLIILFKKRDEVIENKKNDNEYVYIEKVWNSDLSEYIHYIVDKEQIVIRVNEEDIQIKENTFSDGKQRLIYLKTINGYEKELGTMNVYNIKLKDSKEFDYIQVVKVSDIKGYKVKERQTTTRKVGVIVNEWNKQSTFIFI